MKNYYQILEVSETASHDEVKKQYRFMSQAWHPDKFPSPEQKKKAEEKIKDINEAYDVLGKPEKRKEYDRQVNTGKSPHSQTGKTDYQNYYKPQDSEKRKEHDTYTNTKKTDSQSYRKTQNQTRVNTNNSEKKISSPGIWVFVGILTMLVCTMLGGVLLFRFNQPKPIEINTPTIIVNNISSTATKPVSPTNTEAINPTLVPNQIDFDKKEEDMIFIEAEFFIMGRNDSATNESPEHTVYLDGYYIDKYEVTNFSYNACVKDGVCQPPTQSGIFSNSSYFGNPEFETYPVVYVNWEMANLFCQWRDARLPTEAEWEKAARGINSQIYPWGNEFLENHSNFCDQNCPNDWANQSFNDGYASTSPVGAFPLGQSSYGAFDMVGNVYEWVNDWYSENYYSQSPQNNPVGPVSGQDRVIRGGAWGDVLGTNAISRASFTPTISHEFIGFRCARSAN